MSTIGARMRKLLEESGYSQKELAGMVGVTEAAMTRYLHDERVPRVDVISNLATALNTTSDYIISGVQEEQDFSEIKRLVARNSKTMTQEEKMALIKLIMGK